MLKIGYYSKNFWLPTAPHGLLVLSPRSLGPLFMPKQPLKTMKSESVFMYLCVYHKNWASCHWQWTSFRKGSYARKCYCFLGDNIFLHFFATFTFFKLCITDNFSYFGALQIYTCTKATANVAIRLFTHKLVHLII